MLLAPPNGFLHTDVAMVPMIFTRQSLASLVLWMCQKQPQDCKGPLWCCYNSRSTL